MPASERLRNIVLLLVIVLAFGLAYTTLHEGGHALAALSFGGRVTDFDVNFFDLGAHVGLDGDFSRPQNAVINVSGAALPLLVWLLAILLLPRGGGFALLWTRIVLSMGTLNTLLAWIILPLQALGGNAPPGDDVTRFLGNSGISPLAVAAGATALYLAGWTLFLRRTDLRQALASLGLAPGTDVPRRRLVFAGLAVLVVLVLAVVAVFFLLDDPAGPPGDYARIARIDLAVQDPADQVVYRFTAREGELVGLYVDIENVAATYLDLSVIDADGRAYVLLHGENFSADAGSSQGEYGLASGEARLVLTGREATGTLTIYVEAAP